MNPMTRILIAGLTVGALSCTAGDDLDGNGRPFDIDEPVVETNEADNSNDPCRLVARTLCGTCSPRELHRFAPEESPAAASLSLSPSKVLVVGGARQVRSADRDSGEISTYFSFDPTEVGADFDSEILDIVHRDGGGLLLSVTLGVDQIGITSYTEPTGDVTTPTFGQPITLFGDVRGRPLGQLQGNIAYAVTAVRAERDRVIVVDTLAAALREPLVDLEPGQLLGFALRNDEVLVASRVGEQLEVAQFDLLASRGPQSLDISAAPEPLLGLAPGPGSRVWTYGPEAIVALDEGGSRAQRWDLGASLEAAWALDDLVLWYGDGALRASSASCKAGVLLSEVDALPALAADDRAIAWLEGERIMILDRPRSDSP